MQTSPGIGRWRDQAKQWNRIVSPLRPHVNVVSNVRRVLGNIADLHRRHRGRHAEQPWPFLRLGPLFEEVKRILHLQGRLWLRTFVRPEQPAESCQIMCERTNKAKIGSFRAFKWHLAMALAAEAGNSNVAIARIHAIFESRFPDRRRLAATTGWSVEQIGTIDVYGGSRVRYRFPTLSEVRHARAGKSQVAGLAYGSYEFSERCPVLALEPGN